MRNLYGSSSNMVRKMTQDSKNPCFHLTIAAFVLIGIILYFNWDTLFSSDDVRNTALQIRAPTLLAKYDQELQNQRRSLAATALGAGLSVSMALASTSGYFTKVTCSGAAVTTVFGNIAGAGACLSSIAVFLITTAITGALGANGVQSMTSRDESDKRYVYHDKYDVHLDRHGSVYEDHSIFNKTLASALSNVGVSNLTVFDHQHGSGIVIHTIHYTDKWGDHASFHANNDINSFLHTLAYDWLSNNSTEDASLHKRGISADVSSSTYTKGDAYSQFEAEEEGDAEEDEKAGDGNNSIENYLSDSPSNKYCIQTIAGGTHFMKGEVFFDGSGSSAGICQNNY
ncbi:Piso0_005920 [Millerozyma farinosa CBS 7064]|uniref:Piso0_005920 protein n=1 Tax=Pichia sorbitophila (strain ATCC MYA-4447 / BCRC 22081 / CBS 7064 / NBRC 10061 / NRRL Y-12695) TaxID=559304 RepID=G8Y392_PICSO|nr:Piso0_005920 [Millerozyma farinosa CBS 7064]